MLVGTAMTGQSDQASDHARQCPFHSGHDDQCVGGLEMGELVQEPMQSGDADVGDQRDLAVPGLGRDLGFLGDRQVTGAGRHDHDPAQFGCIVMGRTHPERAADGIVLAVRKSRLEMLDRLRIDAGSPIPLARDGAGS